MTFSLSRSGFSLIELLVVVAIIGILSSVGLVAYQVYITSTKDEVGIANANEVARLMNTDHIAITSDLKGRSTFADGLSSSSLCRDQADRIVHQLNTIQNKKNDHDESRSYAFNGNRAWSSVNYLDTVNNVNYFTGCSVNVTSDTVKVPRGRMMVACVNNTATIGSSSYKIYTCHCSGEAECETTDVADDCGSSPFLGYADEDTCRVNWFKHDNNTGKCASPGAFN